MQQQPARMQRGLRLLGLGLSAALLLAACSDDTPVRAPAEQKEATGRVAVARGIVDVDGGLIAMALPLDGVIASAPVKDGDKVRKGQVLLAQDDALVQQEIAVATADVQVADERLKAARAQLQDLQRNAARLATGASEGVSSRQQAEAATLQLADKQAEAGIAEAQRDMARHKLDTARLRLRQLSLVAPEAGTVVGQVPAAGSYGQAGKPVLSLLPARPLQVRAELSAAYVDAVKPGMSAVVIPDRDGPDSDGPMPRAKVVRISPVYAQGRLPADAGRGAPRVVDCILQFEGEAPVRFGQHVRVEFHR
ncbi:HlyD family efflux transporter periplasmic adaptor subunit [Stenotrophomonas sp. 24(2023)]|uniref:HlyD family secretion protein n=1 Tax=Stenotrophomonas sp. 24(2023) TaxID=3068324 RepID=UPI0027E076E2|nr:HlyD family efflux transporter periplasmic adaptor subunit [Stenotrophomonas sp. 24(2023)]WMJ68635.1 HlyD family efflux transporter periplasmic adaptor subunit [Stenotrophomonas sp. 24(2023)]